MSIFKELANASNAFASLSTFDFVASISAFAASEQIRYVMHAPLARLPVAFLVFVTCSVALEARRVCSHSWQVGRQRDTPWSHRSATHHHRLRLVCWYRNWNRDGNWLVNWLLVWLLWIAHGRRWVVCRWCLHHWRRWVVWLLLRRVYCRICRGLLRLVGVNTLWWVLGIRIHLYYYKSYCHL